MRQTDGLLSYFILDMTPSLYGGSRVTQGLPVVVTYGVCVCVCDYPFTGFCYLPSYARTNNYVDSASTMSEQNEKTISRIHSNSGEKAFQVMLESNPFFPTH